MITIGTEKYRRIIGAYLSILLLVLLSFTIHTHSLSIINVLRGALGMASLFFLSFISSLSIIPIPYLVIVVKIAPYVNPLLTSIVVGLGAALGETISWCFGRLASKALEGTIYARRTKALLKYFQQKKPMAIPVLAFIFSLTFLPDKVLYLPLGVIKYSIWGILPFTILGKVLMAYFVLFFGRKLYTYLVDFEGDTVSFVITTTLLATIMLILVFIDWEKILMKKISQPHT